MGVASSNTPPPGWRATDGILQPDTTVAGYLARGRQVKGRCHLRDCRRTCEVDTAKLAIMGFGALPVDVICRWMKCLRIEGCALSFQDQPGPGLPISALLGRAHVSIRFRCTACKFHRTALPDQVLAKLRTKGPAMADDATVEGLSRMAKDPCKACGKTAWRVDVLWPGPISEGARRTPPAR